MDHIRALEKIKKLLLKSQKNDQEEEMKTAAEIAQKLMTKYGITREMLDAEEGKAIITQMIDPLRRVTFWRVQLAEAVTEPNGCISTFFSGEGIKFIGRVSDIETSRVLYLSLRDQVTNITRRAAKEAGHPGRVWSQSFRLGMVDTLESLLARTAEKASEDIYEEMHSQCTDVVILDEAFKKYQERSEKALKWAVDKLGLQFVEPDLQIDEDAFSKGQREAHDVEF